jgi:hypothetical protein
LFCFSRIRIKKKNRKAKKKKRKKRKEIKIICLFSSSFFFFFFFFENMDNEKKRKRIMELDAEIAAREAERNMFKYELEDITRKEVERQAVLRAASSRQFIEAREKEIDELYDQKKAIVDQINEAVKLKEAEEHFYYPRLKMTWFNGMWNYQDKD